MIDPLLSEAANGAYPPPAPTQQRVPKKTPIPLAKRHPALSARILAVGLSTTAFIGMTSGYTLAQKQPVTQPVVQDPVALQTVPAVQNAPASTPATVASVPQKYDAPVTNNSIEVVQVPVPVAASPATPGVTTAPVYQPQQTQQESSGSR